MTQPKSHKSQIIDRVGQRKGHLECVSFFASNEQQQAEWTFKCDCGNTVNRVWTYKASTCGVHCPFSKQLKSAKAKAVGGRKAGPKGSVGLQRLFDQYRKRARTKGYPFELSLSEFGRLTSQNCHYCGAEPEMNVISSDIRNTPKVIENSRYTYNSIDRIDSNIGYIDGNCRPACKKCNIMKWNMTVEEFYGHMRKVLNFSVSVV